MIQIERPACPHPEALNNQNYKHPANKAALREASNGKCMYCESEIDHSDFAHIEHIKPKRTDKFPELAYVWSNLGYCCEVCNNSKASNYDTNTPYIDPYAEDPSEHIVFAGAIAFQKQGSERGELTIRDIKLNRPELAEKRMAKIDAFHRAIDAAYRTNNDTLREAAISALHDSGLPDKEFSLCIRSFLELHR